MTVTNDVRTVHLSADGSLVDSAPEKPSGSTSLTDGVRMVCRIAVALLMGFVVSEPITLKIFSSEIERDLDRIHRLVASASDERTSGERVRVVLPAYAGWKVPLLKEIVHKRFGDGVLSRIIFVVGPSLSVMVAVWRAFFRKASMLIPPSDRLDFLLATRMPCGPTAARTSPMSAGAAVF